MVEDIQASRKAGMKVAAVTWGLHSRKRLASEKPDAVVDDDAKLKEYIRSLG
jgi:phosphoglycolate phosphatase-like HAD superfamily hydrolase